MSSPDSEEVIASAPSTVPFDPAIAGDDSSGDTNNAGNDAAVQNLDDEIEEILNDDTTGKQVTPDEQKAREGRLRSKYGHERKLLLTQLQNSDPEALKKILTEDEDLARSAAKFGITPEKLSQNANSSSSRIPEAFVALASERNLNEAEAKKAWELADTLAQTGLSEELAHKTALEQVASVPEVPPSIPHGGSAASGNEALSGLVNPQTFTNWDTGKRRAYREKHGNKFLE